MRTYYITQGTLLSALCDLNGKEIQKRRDTHTHTHTHRVDSLYSTVEIIQHCKATILQ